MKHLVFFALMALTFNLKAQPVKGTVHKGIPPFRIELSDGTNFTAKDLVKDRPLMMVYFDPDCDHCELFVKDLLRNSRAFSTIQVVLVTYVPVQQVKNFITKTGLSGHPGIKTGTEGTAFIVRYHYGVVQFPYLALHDSTGKLFATFESEVPPAAELARMFANR